MVQIDFGIAPSILSLAKSRYLKFLIWAIFSIKPLISFVLLTLLNLSSIMFLLASQRTPLKSQHLSILKCLFTSSLKNLRAFCKLSQSLALTPELKYKTEATAKTKSLLINFFFFFLFIFSLIFLLKNKKKKFFFKRKLLIFLYYSIIIIFN